MVFARPLTASLPLVAAVMSAAEGPSITYAALEGAGGSRHVVFLSGDEEYRSEEGLPMLAKILARRHGFRCTVLFALGPDGTIDPECQDCLAGSEALDTADAIVMLLRFRRWPPEVMERFAAAWQRGVPIVALRTSTHAFAFREGPYREFDSFGKRILGEQWVSHWGRHKQEATRGVLEPGAAAHPVLRGVADIFGTTDVYEAHPPEDAVVLLRGQVLQGMAPTDSPATYRKKRSTDAVEQPVNDPMMPIAWVREARPEAGRPGRVLCTTMGAATDLACEDLRRLIVNGVFWGLGLDVPSRADVTLVDPYRPSLYGFRGHRRGLRPADFALGIPFPPVDDGAFFERAIVSRGDTSRLRRVLARARDGNPVTIGVIGGSITQGAAASKPENRYGNRFAAWWEAAFPKAAVTFVNAGIGATGSNYGALRAARDLLEKHPDVVVAEYGVNDGNSAAFAETLEGLLRQILHCPNSPAVMLLFTMHRQGTNAQEWHGKVGAHYRLPMLSFRDAFWPEIAAGRILWEDVEADLVHPNDRGHAAMAGFLARFCEEEMADLPDAADPDPLRPLPPPLLGDLFEYVGLLEGEQLVPVENEGWVFDPKVRGWTSDTPGSAVEFEVEGQAVLSMHHVVKGPMGRARVTVDGESPRVLEGWFDQTWGGYRQSNELARGLRPGLHRVRFELLEERHAGSSGCGFRILGLGTAGAGGRGDVAPPPPEYRPAGHSAWDFWFARDGATTFAFYLQAPDEQVPKWGHSSVGLATSGDLRHWVEVGEVLRANPRGQWNDRSIATGSVWRHDDAWLMLFTAHGRDGGLGLARSRNGLSWSRVGDGAVPVRCHPFRVPDAPYWRETGFAAGTELTYRVLADPYVLPEPIDGHYLMVANAVIDGEPADKRGCLALFRSPDGTAWDGCGIVAAPRCYDRLETPQMWRHGERWYLYFGAARENPVYRANMLAVASSPAGPFVPAADPELRLPDGRSFYIAKVIRDPSGREVLLACLGAERLSRPYPVRYEEDGSLTLAPCE
ncbi:MAG: hypothetical protein JXR77_07855 [Lentisphaeria bacterium]|nr:hypothetical protein [Lentisphaeria bacterium]